ncbi:hypothetical protein K438DRAFT_1788177 [Mycena galopus ATCC 62051]|nr:hypothetical protein K438DRAFT_1788177 [Mycena galopus ATCC 62051]
MKLEESEVVSGFSYSAQEQECGLINRARESQISAEKDAYWRMVKDFGLLKITRWLAVPLATDHGLATRRRHMPVAVLTLFASIYHVVLDAADRGLFWFCVFNLSTSGDGTCSGSPGETSSLHSGSAVKALSVCGANRSGYRGTDEWGATFVFILSFSGLQC